ncbi:MAG: type II secretion system GspH family protein [Pseudomonadales bacterium]|jgi:prepilin-type N-terminal cleavage/methylation domain-containing protein|nr:type II secretion system GspH family protein [Pseudomonadales bacterium]
MKIRSNQGFTLIELMIVIAIIAILSVLGVTNFGAALRRARDAQRRSDVIELQMALEVCYDIRTGLYFPGTPLPDNLVTNDFSSNTWNNMVTNMFGRGCLNRNTIHPANDQYGYFAGLRTYQGRQAYLLCTALEEWTGNRAVAPATVVTGRPPAVTAIDITFDDLTGQFTAPILCDSTHLNCNLFCITQSQ